MSSTTESQALERLLPGQEILFGGNRVVRVSEELAAAFQPGDQIRVVERTGELLHIHGAQARVAAATPGVEGIAGACVAVSTATAPAKAVGV